MKKYLDRISQDMEEANWEGYWVGFELVAYALYNSSHVYLFNHPKFNDKQLGNYQTLKRNEQFNGCTLILFEEYPTAIVDLELFNDYEGLYSTLVHELFHGYQSIKGEKRFPDEMKGITYPLTKENVELRNQERFNLFHALMENDAVRKKQYLYSFVALREQRALLIHEHLLYENLIETVEGPAWHVELKAYTEKSSLPYRSVLQKYGQDLLDKYESTSNIRRGCYSSGLFMCLLLDELSPGWGESFLESEETLYDFFKLHSGDYLNLPIVHLNISSDTEDAIHFALSHREKEFEKFHEQKGVHLHIIGEMTAKAFDPMNIISLEERLLHKNFLKVRIHDEEFLFRQPVMAYCKSGTRNINQLHLILKNTPIENMDSLKIEGVGEMKGRIVKQENIYYLYIQ
jgi:uncharacterized C2H2 Zn-finger protein